MPRGGRRSGKQGKPYPNRSDLRQAGQPLPKETATGQPYGAAKAQREAMEAIPLRRSDVPVPQAGGAPVMGPGRPPLPFNRPTERPDEPITAGLSTGAGVGPEALNLRSAKDADLSTLAPYLPTLELLASQPNATVATRNLIRRIRGSMPAEFVQRDQWAG